MAGPLTTGDDILLSVRLDEGGTAVNLVGSTVSACFQNGDGARITDVVAQSAAETGADWATGLLVVRIPRAQVYMSRGDAYLEIQWITVAGVRRTFPLVHYDVQAGSID